jgi:[ribosomal protein S5]-alanine N-acetyltransferase
MTAPIVLRTERLILRPFQDSDVEDALSYRDDRECARFLPHIPRPFTRRDAEAFVALNMSQPWEQSPTFGVVLDRTLIGTVNFEVEADTRTAMVGYAIGRAWWGRGLAAEGARAAMTWAIYRFSLVRIWASTDARHVRSQRVLEKLGFQREVLRVGDHIGRAGKLVNEVVYGLKLAPMGNSSVGRLPDKHGMP